MRRLLPFEFHHAAAAGPATVRRGGGAEEPLYLVEPSREDVLAALIPMAVAAELFCSILEAMLGEQAQRSLAMRSASDNADSMTKTADANVQQGPPGPDHERNDRDHQRKRRGQGMSAGAQGTVVQVIGSILDAEFPRGAAPRDPQRPDDRQGDRRKEDAPRERGPAAPRRQPDTRGGAGFHGRHPAGCPIVDSGHLHHRARGNRGARPGLQPSGGPRGRQGARHRAAADAHPQGGRPVQSARAQDGDLRDRDQGDRPPLPLCARRENGAVRRRRGGQDRHHRGADPQHRDAVRRLLDLRRGRRADAGRQRPVERDGRLRRSSPRRAWSSAR